MKASESHAVLLDALEAVERMLRLQDVEAVGVAERADLRIWLGRLGETRQRLHAMRVEPDAQMPEGLDEQVLALTARCDRAVRRGSSRGGHEPLVDVAGDLVQTLSEMVRSSGSESWERWPPAT